MDRGAWRAAVHWAAKSVTRLSDLPSLAVKVLSPPAGLPGTSLEVF